MTVIEKPGPPGLRYRLFFRAYRVVFRAMMPFVWRYFRRRAAKDPAYGDHLKERRGEGEGFVADLWLHAVSLGEMTSAEPLVRAALDDGVRVLTTHATPAGRKRAEATFADDIAADRMAVRWAPIDRLCYWRDFFRLYAPKAGAVMEMEFCA